MKGRNFNEYALALSTAMAGLGALWTWLVAPSKHILWASYFLFLNWFEGFITFYLILLIRCDSSSHNLSLDFLYKVFFFRTALLACEMVCLQALVENRLKSLWHVPSHSNCFDTFLFAAETSTLCFGIIAMILQLLFPLDLGLWWVQLLLLSCAFVVPMGFVAWAVQVLLRLCCVFATFQRALRRVKREELNGVKSLRASRWEVQLQAAGVIFSLSTTFVLVGAIVDMYIIAQDGADPSDFLRGVLAACANLILNTVGAVLLSGAHRLLWWTPGSERSSQLHAAARLCKLNAFRKSTSTKGPLQQAWKTDKGAEWEEKTAELAARGISLRNLLTFYKLLGDSVMPSYEPSRHSTNDVVRLAIIPLTAAHSSSYAEQVNQGRKMIPKKMVTHSWSNLFRDLLASVLADALGEHTFEFLARLLSDRAGTELVEQMLLSLGRLDDSYWICAFAVNQHSGICGANPNGNVDPVTLIPHPICDCGKPKMFNKTPPLNLEGESIQCEMNKFDDMMAYLAGKDESFAEVIAVDEKLDLFERAWCMAEVAEAKQMGMEQNLKLRNKETLIIRQNTLRGLDVKQMQASRPEDVKAILAKIPDTKAFNDYLQDLIFDQNSGLLTNWHKADALQQMEEASRVLRWARISEAQDGAIIWREWVS